MIHSNGGSQYIHTAKHADVGTPVWYNTILQLPRISYRFQNYVLQDTKFDTTMIATFILLIHK
jgi:hypothetical protein